MAHGYTHLAYLCEISIALNFAYHELIKTRKLSAILSMRDDIKGRLSKEVGSLPSSAHEPRELGNALLKKLTNLDSLNEHDFNKAWLTDECYRKEKCALTNSAQSECLARLSRNTCETHLKYKLNHKNWLFYKNKTDIFVVFWGAIISSFFIIVAYPAEEMLSSWMITHTTIDFYTWWFAWAFLSATIVAPCLFLSALSQIENQFGMKVQELNNEYREVFKKSISKGAEKTETLLE